MAILEPTEPVRAPEGALGWTPSVGWIFEAEEMPERIGGGHFVLVVTDGYVRGITNVTTAPLTAVLRVETELTELVQALLDIAEHVSERLTERRAES